jgi:hypothetical protein
MEPKPTTPNPVAPLTVPSSLSDDRSAMDKAKEKAASIKDKLAESAIVDQATNAAAIIVREKGSRNKKALAKRIGDWIDDLAKNHGGFVGRIIQMLPLKTMFSKGIDKLVDVIADWLEEFSDASEDDDDETAS